MRTYRYEVSASPSCSGCPDSTAGRDAWVNEMRDQSVPTCPSPSSR